jgi:type IV secretion system protein TrbL
MACGLTDPVGCVTDVIGGAAKSAADSAFSAIAHDFGQAAESIVNWLWQQISAATAVSLGGSGFDSEISITAAIAVTVGVGLFVIQVVVSVLRHQPGGLARAGRGLLVAFVAGGLSIAVLDVLLEAVDSLSAGVVQVATGGTITQMGAKLLAPSALSQVSNAAVVILLSLVMVAASVVVWAALMVRKLLIIVAAVFAPIAFSGSLADFSAGWVRRWIETTVALVFSKLVLVIIFTIGLGVLTNGVGQSSQSGARDVTQSLTQTFTGALILVMAGLSPWLAIKLVHFTGDSFHTIHQHVGSTAAGAQMVAASPRKISALRPVSSSSSPGPVGQGASGSGGSGVSAAPAPKAAGTAGGGTAGPASGASAGSASAAGATAATGGTAAAAVAAVGAAKATTSAAQTAVQRATESAANASGGVVPPAPTPAKTTGPASRRD